MSTTSENQNEIVIDTKASMSFKRETKLVIVESDVWERLKLDIANIGIKNNWFHEIAFALFGFAGSAIITLISLWNNEGCENVKTWLAIAIVVPVIVGALCLYFCHVMEKSNTKFTQSVNHTIGKIEDKNK